jgi:hypothetical protein
MLCCVQLWVVSDAFKDHWAFQTVVTICKSTRHDRSEHDCSAIPLWRPAILHVVMPFHICQSDNIQPLSGTFIFQFTSLFCLRSAKSCGINLHRLNTNVDKKCDRSVGSFYNLFHMNLTLSKLTNSRIIRHRTPETVPHSHGSLFYTSWHAVWVAVNLTRVYFSLYYLWTCHILRLFCTSLTEQNESL